MTTSDLDKLALQGEEMPIGLDLADQLYFQTMKCLYHAHSMGAIDKDQAKREKVQVLKSHSETKADLKLLHNTGKMYMTIKECIGEVITVEQMQDIIKALDGLE
ncbi:MAG: hypothetical protein ACRDD7_06120 [Peptostreptococcaceae bacterium]